MLELLIPQLSRRSLVRKGAVSSAISASAKRMLDLFGSATLLLVMAPLLGVLAVLVKTSPGPLLFAQQRVGRHGRMFACLKFRTMCPDADARLQQLLEGDDALKAEWARDQKLRNDPRVTAVGKLLRKTSLDELPQLFNVLRGEMSLVGPRPIVEEELQRYARAAVWYLAVRPGMTGLWQVSGRNEVDYARRVALDSYYVRRRNFAMDCVILLQTLRIVVRGGDGY